MRALKPFVEKQNRAGVHTACKSWWKGIFCLLAALSVLAVALHVQQMASAAQPEAAARPKLILMISVDQMRADYLTRFQDYYSGGLKWLSENGVVFENGYQNHAVTETGPGHSTLLSGMNPGHSGIVSNDWYDREHGTVVYCVQDDNAPIIQDPKAEGRSPKNFKATTLGDWLKDLSVGSRVISISGKDRSAILMAGQTADEVYWYNTSNGRFASSTYYLKKYPSWMEALNRKRIPAAYLGKTWDYLKPSEFYNQFGQDFVAEEDAPDPTFPHPIGGLSVSAGAAFYNAFTQTPFLDELILTASQEAIRANKLGMRGETDLLCVGLSATDIIGHAYGPWSHEIADQLLRLDQSLGSFLKFVDGQVGLRNSLIVLSADHGVLPLPEQLAARGTKSSRLRKQDILLFQNLNAHLSQKFKFKENWVTFYGSLNLYLNYPAVARHNLLRSDVENAIKEYLSGSPVVAAVYSRADLELDSGERDGVLGLFRNSFDPDRSGDVFIQFKEFILPSFGRAGTSHISVYPYDRRVPIILYSPAWKQQRVSAEAHTTDIAPTLAQFLNLHSPEKLDGVSRLGLIK
ncbi:MAG TPA: alkaline phosphatase family protein [Acidobacteriota bacterium]|jgi:predicted AlkP superfamily pyrophosphatase or phosphodiesterase